MANADIPRGFAPVRTAHGQPYTGAFRTYSIAAGDGTATFVGDPVKLAGTAQTIDGVTYADVVQAATGDVIAGVVVGFAPNPDNLALMYRAASTQRLVYVCDDPDMLYEIQEVSGGTSLTANDIGLNANFVVAAGNTTTGLSGVELNNVGEATTNTLDCQIVGLVNRPDNAVGENAKWLVKINRSRYANQVAGA